MANIFNTITSAAAEMIGTVTHLKEAASDMRADSQSTKQQSAEEDARQTTPSAQSTVEGQRKNCYIQKIVATFQCRRTQDMFSMVMRNPRNLTSRMRMSCKK